MPDQELDYRLNLVKGTDDAPAVTDELKQVQGAAAGAGAAGAGMGASIAEGMKGAKEEIHQTHTWVRAAEQAMGLWGLAVEGAIVIWELFKNKTEEVNTALINEFAANQQLIKSLEDAQAAGAKLTAAQVNLLAATKAVAAINQGEAVDNLKKVNDQILESVKANEQDYSAKMHALNVTIAQGQAEEKSAAYGFIAAEARKRVADATAEAAKTTEKYSNTADRLNQQYAANAAQIEALGKGYKDVTEAAAAAGAAATAHAAALDAAAKATAKVRDNELKAQQQHNSDMIKNEQEADKTILQDKTASAAKKLALLKKEEADEIAATKANAALQKQIIDDDLAAHITTKEEHDQQMEALETKTQDRITAIMKKGETDQAKVTQEAQAKIGAAFASAGKAAEQAAAQQIEAGAGAAAALDAGGAALVKSLANQAADSLVATGVQAAGIAFASAPNPYVGAVEAAGVFAWYAGLAAIVGGVGGALASSMTPSSGGGSSGGGSSTPTASSAASASSPAPASSSSPSGSAAPSSAVVAGSGSAAGGQAAAGNGMTNVTVMVLLDSQVILNIVQQGAQNGDLVLTAKCIAPS